VETMSVNQLVKIYRTCGVEVTALDDVSFSIKKGEFVSVVGKSGSGKSTLLYLLGGLERPSSGSIFIEGTEINRLHDKSLTLFRRRHIGFIFQHYNLIPTLSVYDNILLPLRLDKAKIDIDYVESIIGELGINDKKHISPIKLSGGQQQRVAIARALVTRPSIVLADEPTGNLDVKTSSEVIELLRMTSKMFNQTVVVVTHDRDVAVSAVRSIHLVDGKILSKEF